MKRAPREIVVVGVVGVVSAKRRREAR